MENYTIFINYTDNTYSIEYGFTNVEAAEYRATEIENTHNNIKCVTVNANVLRQPSN